MRGKIMNKSFEEINEKFVEKFFSIQITQIEKYFTKKAVRAIKNKISNEFYDCIIKLLVVEIHSDSNKELLGNGDSIQKYKKFNSFFSTDEGIDILLLRYPSLKERLMLISKEFNDFISEFYARYRHDKKTLTNMFKVEGRIINIEFFGDKHAGRQNIFIELEKGKLFYKNRSLITDEFVEKIIDNLKSVKFGIKIPNYLSCGNYGWQEAIETKCIGTGYQEIYYKFGVLSAIAYIFNITDLHKENILINNNELYILDTESVLQTEIFSGENSKSNLSATERLNENLLNSIFLSELYPVTMSAINNKIDISGITGLGGTVIKGSAQIIVNPMSSDIRIKYGDYVTPQTYNRPKGIDPRNFVESIKKGFQDTLYEIDGKKRIFLSIIDQYRSRLRTRVIFRNTSEYGQILRLLNNPKYLCDVNNVVKLTNRMKKNAESDSVFNKIIDTEIYDICNGSVPYFYFDHRTEEVKNLKGNVVISSKHSNIRKTVRDKISRLNIEKIEKQSKLIDIALAKPVKNWDMGEKIDVTNNSNLATTDQRYILKNMAIKLMDSMLSKCVYDSKKNGCTWLSIDITSNEIWAVEPMGYSLYGGLPGIILTLAYLFKVSNDVKYKIYCEKALKELEYMLDNLVWEPRDISVFNGVGGLVYTYYNLWKIFKNFVYKEKYKYWLHKLLNALPESKRLDFLDGASGVLTLLSKLYIEERDSEILPFIKNLQKRLLLERHINCRSRKIWESDIISGEYLNGFSHGISGIIYGLVTSNRIVRELEVNRCVKDAVDIENMNFVDGNWIDLRNRENRLKKNFPDPIHWCHGAPGIGISRINIYRYLDKEFSSKDIEMAVSKTINEGFGGCDALCHGNFGNLELLLQYSLSISSSFSYYDILKITTLLMRNKNDIDDFAYGIPQKNIVSYGLMTGVSGIIYQLLRLYDPYQVPSVLDLSIITRGEAL